MERAYITVRCHRETGLMMATSDDLPGFVVHAHSEQELKQKLKMAFESFMKATGRPVQDATVEEDSPAGYTPPAYIARAHLQAA